MIKLAPSIFLAILLFLGCGVNVKPSQIYSAKNIILNSDSTLQTGWYHIVDTESGWKRQLERDSIFYSIDSVAIVTAGNIVKFEIYQNAYGNNGLSMKFDKNGADAWSIATRTAANKGSKLAFVLDDRLIEVANVTFEISNGMAALNRGIFTKEELQEIQKQIEN
jgi:preprotein translocase subunit SecD